MPDLRTRPAQIVLALAVLVSLVAVYLGYQRRSEHTRRLALESAVGAVPLFLEAPAITLYGRDEQPVPLAQYRGRAVFVNFWATWCGPCIAEMPSLIRLQEQLDPADIAFVSIAEDDTWPPLDQYLRRNPLPFDLYRDRPPRVEIPFATTSYPTSFLIDRDGQAVYRFNGARDWDDPRVRELFALEGIGTR